jgi:hypothetical protein
MSGPLDGGHRSGERLIAPAQRKSSPKPVSMQTYAYSDEAGHAFQYEAGHQFRSEAGRRSDLMSATGVLLAQIDLDDVSGLGCGQARSSLAGRARRLRKLSPESSIR